MPGMCQRITRQSNAAKATSRRGRRDAHPELEERKIVAGDVVDKVDKIDMEDKVEDKGSREGRDYHHHREQLDKQLAEQLRQKAIYHPKEVEMIMSWVMITPN